METFLLVALAVCLMGCNGATFSPVIKTVRSNSTCINTDLCNVINGSLSCAVCESNARYIIDGDTGTKWSSFPTGNLINSTAQLEIELKQVYSIRRLLVSFVKAPLTWSITSRSHQYTLLLVNDTRDCTKQSSISFIACQKFTLNEDGSSEIDVFRLLNSTGIDAEKALFTSAIKLDFLEPIPALLDNREQFYAISEIQLQAVCMLNLTNDCRKGNIIYHQNITVFNQGKLLWQQIKSLPMLGIWYLDNVQIVDLYTDNFENEHLNRTLWDYVNGGEIQVAPCDRLSSQNVLLFQEMGNRSVSTVSLPATNSSRYLTFDLGFILSDAESCSNEIAIPKVELYLCSSNVSCELIRLYTLGSCGQCSDIHLLKLRQILSLISKAAVLPYSRLIVLNQTDYQLIQFTVNNTEKVIEDTQLLLIAVQSVLGSNSTKQVHNIQMLFPNGIMSELHSVYRLLQSSDEFYSLNVTAYELVTIVQNITEKISLFGGQSTHLISQTNILLQNLSSLIGRLSLHYSDAREADSLANRSSHILLRQYEYLQEQIDNLMDVIGEAFKTLEEYTSLSEYHNELSRNASNAIAEYKTLLPLIINVSQTVIDDVNEIKHVHVMIEMIFGNVNSILTMVQNIFNSTTYNIASAQSTVNSTEIILENANRLIELSFDIIMSLHDMLHQLSSSVETYEMNLDNFLPKNYPDVCQYDNKDVSCTRGEKHAISLDFNVTRIQNESRFTVEYATEFLDNLNSLPNVDFDGITAVATKAVNIGNSVLELLIDSNFQVLQSNASSFFNRSRDQSVNASNQYSTSLSVSEQSNVQYNRSVKLTSEYFVIESTLNTIANDVKVLERSPNYTSEAHLIQSGVSVLLTTLDDASVSLNNTYSRVNIVNVDVLRLKQAINDTKEVLEETSTEVDQIHEVLLTTESILNETTSGLADILEENKNILSDIDSLLTSVANTHQLIAKINSPTQLSKNGSINPYISLQEPPNVNGSITFGSLDMYVYPMMGYETPAVLFYAGPILSENDPDTGPILEEDYIALTSETSTIRLQWRISGNSFSVERDGTLSSHNEILFTQSGSMFELNFIDGNMPPAQHLNILNNSLSFRITENTVYLIGGIPPNSVVALPQFQNYKSYIGLVTLVLFNGELWSLWNYRSRSMTNFIGEFRRDLNGALQNVWTGSILLNTNTLSFNGNGYISPIRFLPSGLSGTFARGSQFRFDLNIKSVEGLIAFMYDPETNITLEFALSQGHFYMVVDGPSFERIEFKRPILLIDFLSGSPVHQFRLNSANSISFISGNQLFNRFNIQGFQFFTDLNRIKVWFGGVLLDRLPPNIRPSVTTARYEGCLNMALSTGGRNIPLFASFDFGDSYLGSTLQQGVSGACLLTTSVKEIGFNGTGYLSYTQIPKINQVHNNAPVNLDKLFVLSFSFYPVTNSSLLLYVTYNNAENDNDILIYMQNGILYTRLMSKSASTFLSSPSVLSMNEWHQVFVEIRKSVPTQSDFQHKLYLNGILVSSARSPAEYTFIVSNNNNDNELHIGGVPDSLLPNETNFVGCMKDLAYNFQYISLISSGLSSFVIPAGVTPHECPVLNEATSLVSVFAEVPEERTCFPNPPVTLEDTIGGFHSFTNVLSYNVLPLETSSWTLSFALRQLSGDGHVITISSKYGFNLTLSISSHHIYWQLVDGNDIVQAVTDTNSLRINTWTNILLMCNITGGHVVATPAVNDIELGSLTTIHNTALYDAQFPVVFGYINNTRQGFVGCIKDIKINGNETGFKKENITSCLTCYSHPINGWGFTGLSYIMKTLKFPSNTGPEQYHISMEFRANKQYGLLLLVTNTNSLQDPILGIGIYEGILRVSNFSQIGSYISQSMSSLCNTNEQSFHTLNVSITIDSMTITLDATSMTVDIANKPLSDINVYIGGLSRASRINDQNTRLFAFLVREDVGVPPGFDGCLRRVIVHSFGVPNELSDISLADDTGNVLIGYCPS